jgi:large subunit ribosomal protein L4
MQLDVLNIQGQPTGRSVELPEEIFGAEPNQHVVYLAVKQYLACTAPGNTQG